MFVLKDILGRIIAHFYWVSIRLSVVFQEFLAIDPQNSGKLSIDIGICKSRGHRLQGTFYHFGKKGYILQPFQDLYPKYRGML